MIEHHHPKILHADYFCLSSSLIASSNREFACGKCLSISMLLIEIYLYQLSAELPVNT